MTISPSDYEQAIEALHSTAQSLMQAETAEDAAEIAVDAIRDILHLPMNGVYLYDEATQRLRPVAWTDSGEAVVGEPPAFAPGESLAWRAFETGEPEIHGDVSSVPGRFNPDTSIGSEIILPLDDHGVVMIGSDESGAFSELDVSLAQTVATHMTAALDRIEREGALKRQNERLDEFASVVSHDLINPLNVAQGSLELVQDECDSDHLADAVEAVDRSLELLVDLRTLARDGKQVSDIDPVDLAETVAGSWQTVTTADAALRVETNRTIQADQGRLKQLLENLFRNAVKHGGDDVTVTVGDLADGFYVADDGPGISAGAREQVFEAGYSTAKDGTGFGLSIVQGIAEAHNWDVLVTDSEAGGARFEVTGVSTVPADG